MLKDIKEQLEILSVRFETMKKEDLILVEQQLEEIEYLFRDVIFPRLYASLEKDNPAYNNFMGKKKTKNQ